MRKPACALLIATLCLAGCDAAGSSWHTAPPVSSPDKEFELKMRQYALDQARLDTDFRRDVIKVCVGKGYVPVLLNGNIDCKPLK